MKRILYSLLALALAVSCTTKTPEEPTTKLAGEFEQNPPAEVFVSVPEAAFDTVVTVQGNAFSVELPVSLRSTSTLSAGDQTIEFISDGTSLSMNAGRIVSIDSVKSYQNGFLAWRQFLEEGGSGDFDSDIAFCKEIAEQYGRSFIAIEALNMAWSAFPDSTLRKILTQVDTCFDGTPLMIQIKSGLRARRNTAVGQKFVDFHIYQNPENRTGYVSFSDYVGKGKYILVDFWASWCGPCREEVANVKKVYEKYKGDDFDVLSVAVSDKAEDTAKAAKQLGITWNQIVNAAHVPASIYGIQTIPQIMLFGPDGTILKRDLYGDQIEAAVAEALGR